MNFSSEILLGFINTLRGYLWHTTSLSAFGMIQKTGKILVDRRDLESTFRSSLCSNCFEQGAISFFDLVTHRDRDLIGDELRLHSKWPNVMFFHKPFTVFLGVPLDVVASQILFYPELKRRCGLGGIIPRIEVCHVGDLDFSEINQFGLWRSDQPESIVLTDSADELTALIPKHVPTSRGKIGLA
ncbi:hypothetical protein N8737_03125 [Verrucomicrobia bacterium]|nr:hypothetical protein [Verrucomicrobiota bacterium]